jgi:hypothetical protein
VNGACAGEKAWPNATHESNAGMTTLKAG